MDNETKIQAYFVNIKSEIRKNLLEATSSIRVAMAWLMDEDLIRDLAKKAKEGLTVEIAISNSFENFKNPRHLSAYLKDGGKLFVSENKFVHHKFCLIDDNHLITGSYNWTYSAENYNEENIIVLKNINKLLKDQFLIRFKKICSEFCIQKTSLKDLKTINARVVIELIDEEEMLLRQEFQNEIEIGTETAKRLKIAVNFNLIYDMMKAKGGGVELVKWIIKDTISKKEYKSGLKKLYEHNQLPLSFEYLVCKSKYGKLFTSEEIGHCKKVMSDFSITEFN